MLGSGKTIIHYKKDIPDNYCMPSGLEKNLSAKDYAKYFTLVNELG